MTLSFIVKKSIYREGPGSVSWEQLGNYGMMVGILC